MKNYAREAGDTNHKQRGTRQEKPKLLEMESDNGPFYTLDCFCHLAESSLALRSILKDRSDNRLDAMRVEAFTWRACDPSKHSYRIAT